MISIIVPVLNEEQIIKDFLKQLSLLSGNFEVIVVDGGSTDQTVQAVSSFAKVICTNTGRANQMNQGAKVAKGDIFLFLHADTFLPSRAIEAIEKALSNQNIIGGRFKIFLDNKRLIYKIIALGINFRDRITSGFTGDQAIFVRKKVFEEMGGFKDFPIMEDLDFARRLKRFGKVVRIPLKVTSSARRWEKKGVLKTIILMWFIRLSYLLGIPPEKLKRFYDEVR